MRVEFVNHASVIFEEGYIRLICDPWLDGTAFDDGWALLSQSSFKPEDFSSITHLWFSHEHPDHFSPQVLTSIPEDVRQRIQVLFQYTDDKKVVRFCEGLGFAEVKELKPGKWTSLSPEFEVYSETHGDGGDSWLFVKTPSASVLNLNDCHVNTVHEAEAILQRLGSIDVLLTQFSISAWDGNAEEIDRRRDGAAAMVNRTLMQARVLGVRHVVPFASFIWFCHAENDYMNSALTGVEEVAARLLAETEADPVVLYPGDVWDPEGAMDSAAAIARYKADRESLRVRPRCHAAVVPMDDLHQIALRFSDMLTHGISALRLRLRAIKLNAMHQYRIKKHTPWVGWMAAILQVGLFRIRPARIWLSDHQTSVTYCLVKGLRESKYNYSECDVALSSAALSYAFRFLWGGETLQVNGRFHEIYPEGRRVLFEYLWLASALNHEEGAVAKPL